MRGPGVHLLIRSRRFRNPKEMLSLGALVPVRAFLGSRMQGSRAFKPDPEAVGL